MENSILTSNEQIANEILGENDAKTFFMNGKSGKDILKQDTINKFNSEVDKENERLSNYFSNLEENIEKLNKNIHNIEIMPIGNYILIKPFSENPFQRLARSAESGLIVDMGGYRPTFKNTDSGEIQEEEQMILTAVVQEVGPECKYVKRDDVIFYPRTRQTPVPFYNQGLMWLNETAVIAVVNENLTERFKSNE